MKKVLIVLAYAVFYPLWMVVGIILPKSISRIKYQWSYYKSVVARAHVIAKGINVDEYEIPKKCAELRRK